MKVTIRNPAFVYKRTNGELRYRFLTQCYRLAQYLKVYGLERRSIKAHCRGLGNGTCLADVDDTNSVNQFSNQGISRVYDLAETHAAQDGFVY
ncbi:MAG: hypothetical protein JWN45_2734 [Acidobacteriaceae bacterium]|nr:hypothetical protein [Acidobacteriaceae bacterium]